LKRSIRANLSYFQTVRDRVKTLLLIQTLGKAVRCVQ
jgi:hypothetical protein